MGAYSRVGSNGFVNYDDGPYVYKNSHVTGGLTWENVCWSIASTEVANWHPLTWLSLQATAQFFGAEPGAFHLTNLALHLSSVALLYGVLRRLTGSSGRSAFVAACFAVHPLHVESVAWAAERKDVLSGFFWLLTLSAYVWFVRNPGFWRYFAVILCFAFGLASKPMLVTLPFVLLLLDYWPLQRSSRSSVDGSNPERFGPVHFSRLAAEKLPLIGLAIACSVITVVAQSKGGAVRPLELLPLPLRVENALVSYVVYLRKAVWPSDLAVMYPYPHDYPFWQVLGAATFLIVVTAFVVLKGRRYRYLPFGWFWYLGTLVPVIGLVQVGIQSWADRYTYLPLIGIYVIVAWGVPDLLARLGQNQRSAQTVAYLTVIALAVMTWLQVGYWRDSVTLWERTIELTDNNYVAHSNLGGALLRYNQLEAAAQHFTIASQIDPQEPTPSALLGMVRLRQGRLAEAIEACRRALELKHDHPDARLTLGNALKVSGRLEEAVKEYEEAIRLRPESSEANNNLGTTLAQLGRSAEAIRCLQEAERLDPTQPETSYNLGLSLVEFGDYSGAVDAYRGAVRLKPDTAKYHVGLAQALFESGHSAEAREEYRVASRLDPNWIDGAIEAAWSMATDPDPARRRGILAVQFARQLCQATDYRRPNFLDTLAAAYAETGRFDEAASYARKALALLPPDGRDAPAVRYRLGLYERRQPYRSALP